jgi:hypothetical protein
MRSNGLKQDAVLGAVLFLSHGKRILRDEEDGVGEIMTG